MSRPGTETYSPGQHVQNFTDREEPLKLILAHLEAPEDQWLPALVFWGVGGIGKTWLTLKLQAHLEGTSTVPGFLESEADAWGRVPKLPCARLDFDPIRNPLGGNYQNDPLAALAAIRSQLGVECPQYDLAAAMLQFRQGNGTPPAHPLSDHAAVAWTIIKGLDSLAISHFVPVGGGIVASEVHRHLEKAGKNVKNTSLMKWVLQKTDSPFLRELKRADAQQLAAEMPRYLAEDLNENLPARKGKRCRAVLIFDTYEEMQILDGNTVRQARRDEWIREFFKRLHYVLVILTGRDYIRWEEHDLYFGERDAANNTVNLEQHLLGGLSREFAEYFLGKCGITSPDLQKAVLQVCVDDETDHPTRAEKAYHPFSLGLCADTIANESGKTDPISFQMSNDRVRALAQRFLRSLPTDAHRIWVEKLAMTWRFDREAALAAYSDTQSREADSAWEMLTRFSFVIRLGRSEWFTLHSRMRGVLTDLFASDQERLPNEHRWWQTYWLRRSQQETDPFAALAWAHYYRLEPEPAIGEWYSRAERAYTTLDMALHYELLGWWNPLGIEVQVEHSPIDAAALNILGQQLLRTSLGNRSRNIRRCIACYEVLLRVYTEEKFPQHWAQAQNNLAIAYYELPTVDRDQNLKRAIAFYEAALRVYTKAFLAEDWAMIQNNLGNAYRDLTTGDRAETLSRAITCYKAALDIRTEASFPRDWATTHINLALAYTALPTGDHQKNLNQAIAYYEATLRVYTEGEFPHRWAIIQNNLGNAYLGLHIGDRADNINRAIDYYRAALRVNTEERFPQQWAMNQNNLGNAYCDLPTGDRGVNVQNAIACSEAALRVYTEDLFPQEWAGSQNNLGNAYCELITGDSVENLSRAIIYYEAALRVYDEGRFPQQWAVTQTNLARTFRLIGKNVEATVCLQNALRGYRQIGMEVVAYTIEEQFKSFWSNNTRYYSD